MRSIFNGHIRARAVQFSVKLYNAIEIPDTRMNMIHNVKGCGGAVGYQTYCKACNDKQIDALLLKNKQQANEVLADVLKASTVAVIDKSEIVKGYRVSEEKYIVLSDEDMAKIRVKSDKIIDIETFVPAGSIPISHYEKPMYAAPHGAVAVQSYSLFREMLRQTKTIGIGRVILRDREELVALSPGTETLNMHIIRFPSEIRKESDVPGFEDVQKSNVDVQQLMLGSKLVEAMTGKFSDLEMTDRYQDSIRELVAAKIAGSEFNVTVESTKRSSDIMSALKESLGIVKKTAVKKKKPAVRKVVKKKRRAV